MSFGRAVGCGQRGNSVQVNRVAVTSGWLVAESRITYVFMPLELITCRYSYGCALPLNFNKP